MVIRFLSAVVVAAILVGCEELVKSLVNKLYTTKQTK
jgi:hypothetical protein